MGPNPARKYVDLISRASGGKFANWDPPRIVEVGDWGYVDKNTASFVKEGNIFKDKECSELLQGVEKPIITGHPEDTFRVSANVKTSLGNDMAVSLGVTGEIGVKVQGSWEISPRSRAAILTATDAYSIYLQAGIVFPTLSRVPKLEGKQIVIETLNCPAFALLLTDKGIGGKASLTLQTRISEVGGSLGNVIGGRWEYFSESGVWRTACGYRVNLGEPDAVYTPLFALKTMPRTRWLTYRGAPPILPRIALPAYEDYILPWNQLDEDGEEMTEDSEDEVQDIPESPEF